ncbi:MAG: hypothetical protein ACK56I_36710, partial [bacterium]
ILRVKTFKKADNANRDENAIIRAERDLTSHIEKELKIELENYRKFENLNAEKITPHFMSMVKSSNKNDCPTKICDDNSLPFENIKDLSAYVGNYFKNIYLNEPDLEQNRGQNSVRDFLGEEVLNKDEVQNAKLSEQEKTELDMPLT